MPTAAEVAEFDTEELERQLGETRRELFNLRFQLATGQLDNFNRIKQVKKDVARMLTELRTREVAEAEGLALAEIPSHRAAAKRRDAEDAAGLDHSSPADRKERRRAKAEAEAEEAARAEAEAETDEVDGTEDVDEIDEVDEVIDADVVEDDDAGQDEEEDA